MNPDILNHLDQNLGISDVEIANLTGIALATVQSELSTGLTTNEAFSQGGLWFLGTAHVSGPLYEESGVSGPLSWHFSSRWYAHRDRWYGPHIYGVHTHVWSWNHGASGVPNYAASGIVMPADGNITKIGMWCRPTDGTHTYRAKIVRQTKVDGANTATSVDVGSELVMTNLATNRMYWREFDLSLNPDFQAGDVLVPLLRGSETSVRYIYTNMVVCVEFT